MILPSVTVVYITVIEVGSVVTTDVPSYVVAFGHPCPNIYI